MLSDHEGLTVMHEGTAGWVVLAIVLLAVGASAALWMSWKDSQEIRLALNGGGQALHTSSQPLKQDYGKQMESLQQSAARAEKTASDLQDQFNKVSQQLQTTQGELKKIREEVHQSVRNEIKQIVALDNEMRGELANKASANDVRTVTGELGGVRTGLNGTRRDLESARSEMGGLIAKNHADIEKLRRLGERDYIEFTVEGKNKPQKVGEVTIELRGTSPSRNKYTVALVVDDKRTEEKNCTVNQPIFFYTQGIQQALELVVNKIARDKIVGYLSVPKALQQTATSRIS